MADVNAGATIGLADPAYVTCWTQNLDGSYSWKKLPLSDIMALASEISGKLGTDDVGGAAFEDAEAYIRVSDYDAAMAVKNAQIAALSLRITALELGGGGGTPSSIVETGILEEGIVE